MQWNPSIHATTLEFHAYFFPDNILKLCIISYIVKSWNATLVKCLISDPVSFTTIHLNCGRYLVVVIRGEFSLKFIIEKNGRFSLWPAVYPVETCSVDATWAMRQIFVWEVEKNSHIF